jgi:hypothetical protein
MAPKREQHELNLQLGIFKASAIGLPAIMILAVIVLTGLGMKAFGVVKSQCRRMTIR